MKKTKTINVIEVNLTTCPREVLDQLCLSQGMDKCLVDYSFSEDLASYLIENLAPVLGPDSDLAFTYLDDGGVHVKISSKVMDTLNATLGSVFVEASLRKFANTF